MEKSTWQPARALYKLSRYRALVKATFPPARRRQAASDADTFGNRPISVRLVAAIIATVKRSQAL
jgi:hypothetical protein